MRKKMYTTKLLFKFMIAAFVIAFLFSNPAICKASFVIEEDVQLNTGDTGNTPAPPAEPAPVLAPEVQTDNTDSVQIVPQQKKKEKTDSKKEEATKPSTKTESTEEEPVPEIPATEAESKETDIPVEENTEIIETEMAETEEVVTQEDKPGITSVLEIENDIDDDNNIQENGNDGTLSRKTILIPLLFILILIIVWKKKRKTNISKER